MENKKLLTAVLTLIFFIGLPNAALASDTKKRTERSSEKSKEATKKQKIKRLKQKAEDGDVDAQIAMGDLAKSKSYSEAMKWYIIAAKKKSAVALQRLASLKDEIQAAIERSDNRTICSQHLQALYKLGCLYLEYSEVPENIARGRAILKSTAQHKHAKSEKMLADMYDKGRHMAPNKSKALEWLYRAMKHDPELRTTKAYRQLHTLAAVAIEEKNRRGHYIMGQILLFGWGLGQQPQQALEMYELAATQGEGKACFQAGSYYARKWEEASEAQQKATRFGQMALSYFKRGVALKDDKCFHELGLCHLLGACGLVENPIEAVRWFTRAKRSIKSDWKYNHRKDNAEQFFARTLQRKPFKVLVEKDDSRPISSLPDLQDTAPLLQQVCTAIRRFEGELMIVSELLDRAPILVPHYQLCPRPELDKALRHQEDPCFMHRSRFEGYSYLTMDIAYVPYALRVERISSQVPFVTEVYDSKRVVRELAAHAKWTAAESLKATNLCDVEESEAFSTPNLQHLQIDSLGQLKSFVRLLTDTYQMAYQRIVGQKEGFNYALGGAKPTEIQQKKLDILKAAEETLWTQVHRFQGLSKTVHDVETELYWKIRNVEPRIEAFDATPVGRSLARYVKEDLE
jgi:TPR repeat protein